MPSFGDADARLMIVGLAPGLRGANRTGRPFTGDYAGDLLYATLLRFGFASGVYDRRPDDGLTLVDCAIVNAVRCVPPQNKPTPQEICACRPYLTPVDRSAAAASRSCLRSAGWRTRPCSRALGGRLGRNFRSRMARGMRSKPAELVLFDSYHCSRYNTNTGVLTEAMFHDVFAAIRAELASA